MSNFNKKLLKVISLSLAIMTFILSPLFCYFKTYDNVYAAVIDGVSEEMMKQLLIPTLITAGLVFENTEAVEATYNDLNEWIDSQIENWNDHEQGWKMPDDPEGPDVDPTLVLMALMGGKVVYDATIKGYKKVFEIGNDLFSRIKSWVDSNFNVNENLNYPDIHSISDLYPNNTMPFNYEFPYTGVTIKFYDANYNSTGTLEWVVSGIYNGVYRLGHLKYPTGSYSYMLDYSPIRLRIVNNDEIYFYRTSSTSTSQSNLARLGYAKYYKIGDEPLESPLLINGVENIVDNPNYDWNNQKTGTKTISIPIETDIDGNPEVDSDGFHKPSIDSDYWVNVEPDKIINDDVTGIPLPEIPEIPEHEENDSKDTGILITIATLLATLLKQITGIRQDTSTMTESMTNTETGTGSGGIGDDTEVATDFEWGDFKKFLDIFYIFIYFIIILILILVKFLSIVFLQLTNVQANASLFNQYPTILSGVNYIKNLKVGGLSITVHQAFEYVFMIFFFIFIIKQIRKLYGAYVYEENERERDNRKDMKMDYYDNKVDINKMSVNEFKDNARQQEQKYRGFR